MSEEWPFTPEVDTGGWQVATQVEGDELGVPPVGTLYYFLDPEFHPNNSYEADEIGANVNLIAAAPRMYRALKTYFSAIDRPWEGANQTAAIDEMREIVDWVDRG